MRANLSKSRGDMRVQRPTFTGVNWPRAINRWTLRPETPSHAAAWFKDNMCRASSLVRLRLVAAAPDLALGSAAHSGIAAAFGSCACPNALGSGHLALCMCVIRPWCPRLRRWAGAQRGRKMPRLCHCMPIWVCRALPAITGAPTPSCPQSPSPQPTATGCNQWVLSPDKPR